PRHTQVPEHLLVDLVRPGAKLRRGADHDDVGVGSAREPHEARQDALALELVLGAADQHDGASAANPPHDAGTVRWHVVESRPREFSDGEWRLAFGVGARYRRWRPVMSYATLYSSSRARPPAPPA